MTVVFGVLYPGWWDPDHEAHLAALRALDDRLEVVAEAYEEPSELRSARGVPPWDDVAHLAPALTDEQRAVFERVECCVTLDLPFDVAAVAPNLRWVQGLGAGVAHLGSAGLADAGITLTSAAGVNATAIAEFVMARILGDAKRLRALDEAQHQCEWSPLFGRELAGATLGLIGLGEINQRVARRARAFDLRVLAMRRSGAPSELVDEVVDPSGLHDVLGASDIVVAAVPESPETEGLMDADAFAAMPPGSMFVNVGRGALVDEAALVAALESGHLRSAALDVTRVEPLPPESPLWTVPNLYLSAHCSSAPDRLFVNLQELVLDNLARYLADEPLRNVQRL